MLVYRKREADRAHFEKPEDMSGLLHALLIARGISTREEAERFLNPGEAALNDPMLLNDMGRAVERLRAALNAGERICVYGDYDVDGVSAAAILCLHLRARGGNVRCYLPSRHTEGYGLNQTAVENLAGETDLLLTVDCGINAVELVALAKRLGMDVIVTDHHRPGPALPDCPVVNPLLDGYPCAHLSGGGVAFKLVEALSGRGEAMAFVDLAALSTVADVVPLTGENRAIVKLGLDSMNRSPRLGIQALREAAGLEDRTLRASTIGFQLGPRLNAGGRLGSAHRAFDLLTADDEARAHALAGELELENTQRRIVEKQILEEAGEMLQEFDFPAHRAIVLKNQGWNTGVLGLAASRLAEKYHYPTILLSEAEGKLTGSCRSIDGVDIFAALTATGEHLLRYGGHRQAAGLTLLPEAFEGFREALDAYLWREIPKDAYIPRMEYDLSVSLEDLDPMTVASLEQMQPTGMGNPQPVLRAKLLPAQMCRVGRDGAHLKLALSQGEHRLGGVFFGRGELADTPLGMCDALFSPKLNAYQGRVRVELELRAFEPCESVEQIQANLVRREGMVLRFLTEMLYNTAMRPNPEPADFGEIRAALADSPQGTLLVAWDFPDARRALEQLEPARLDLAFGRMPDDPRAFNALCVLPVGAKGGPYRRMLRVPGVPEWFSSLPDVDELREIYRALMRLSRRPHVFSGLSGLANSLSSESGLGRIGCAAGLLALHDMHLIELTLDAERANYALCPMQKTDPLANPVFLQMDQWRRSAITRKGDEDSCRREA